MSTITKIKFSEKVGAYLSSRGVALEIRLEIEQGGGDAELDFDGVLGISGSFSDEIFGVLVAEKGPEWFREHIKVTNLTPPSRAAILHALAQRFAAQKS